MLAELLKNIAKPVQNPTENGTEQPKLEKVKVNQTIRNWSFKLPIDLSKPYGLPKGLELISTEKTPLSTITLYQYEAKDSTFQELKEYWPAMILHCRHCHTETRLPTCINCGLSPVLPMEAPKGALTKEQLKEASQEFKAAEREKAKEERETKKQAERDAKQKEKDDAKAAKEKEKEEARAKKEAEKKEKEKAKKDEEKYKGMEKKAIKRGLPNKQQACILKYLSTADGPKNRQQIAEAVGIHVQSMSRLIGSHILPAESNVRNRKGMKSDPSKSKSWHHTLKSLTQLEALEIEQATEKRDRKASDYCYSISEKGSQLLQGYLDYFKITIDQLAIDKGRKGYGEETKNKISFSQRTVG